MRKIFKKNNTKLNNNKEWLRKLLMFVLSLMLLASIPLTLLHEISEQEKDDTENVVLHKKQWNELFIGQKIKIILRAIREG